MKTLKAVKLKIDVYNKRCIIVHLNIPLFLEPETRVRNKVISVFHSVDSIMETHKVEEVCDEECEEEVDGEYYCDCCEYEYIDACETFIDMAKSIKGVNNINFGRHEIAISKAEYFFYWEDIMNELIQILLLSYNKSTEARIVKFEFKEGAKENIGEENYHGFIEKFPKNYKLGI